MPDSDTARATPPTALVRRWRVRSRELDLSLPQIMAICNVTPDSFSDGGEHYSVTLALRYAESALRDGATILDIGGESTRPGARPVSAELELARVMPVLDAVRDALPELLLSIDTSKSVVAREALDAGAHIINDVSGGRLDAAMYEVVAHAKAGLVLMHSRGDVSDMSSYAHATYGEDVVADVRAELEALTVQALAAGVAHDAIVLDPGIGFAKTSEHSRIVMRELDRFTSTGFPLLVGASRKRVIGELTGVTEPVLRVVGSAVAHALAVQRGANIIRTHDVAATREALAVARAL
jgi:dihydropteroate synthase